MHNRLKIYYLYAALPFIVMLVGAFVFFDAIQKTITSNPHPQINYTIFVIIILGGVLILRNMQRLMAESRVLAQFSALQRSGADAKAIQEFSIDVDADIAYVIRMIAVSHGRQISHQEQVAIEHELDKVALRLNARNALPQFMTGLLVGLGLLGTFIGLLSTLNDISALIGSFADIDMGKANPIDVFRQMIERMKAPMQSMGIAFSASLFGLLGSIILGFMMVAMRRFAGEILSLLGSEVAQHIEFSLSGDGFTYSKEGLKRKLSDAGRIPALAVSDVLSRPSTAIQRSLEQPAQQAAIEKETREHDVTPPSPKPAAGTAISELDGEELRVLLRIEDRLAETARLQLRALNAEVDDFNKQRAEMLRSLSEHNEAVGQFRSELQRVGRQLGTVLGIMEKGNADLLSQLSELKVRMADDANETRLIMIRQIADQLAVGESIIEAITARQSTGQ
jgi:hypothetical protein